MPSLTTHDANADRATQIAISILMHRLNGGLNNAVMAIELASAPSAPSLDLARILSQGRAGAERASRSANILDALVRPDKSSLSMSGYVRDVVELLQEYGDRRGTAIDRSFDLVSLRDLPTTAANAASDLVAGIDAIESVAGKSVDVRVVLRASSARIELGKDENPR